MAPLGVGVVGFGWMGRRHAEAFLRLPHHFAAPGPRLAAVADVDPAARAEALALGFERAFEDWREVLADPAVDVVSVTVPNWLHLDVVREAAAAGRQVWVEKPVGRSPKETEAAAAAAAGVTSLVGFDLRFAPSVVHARRLLAEGHLGDLRHVRASFLTGYAADPRTPHGWRFSRELAGSGALGDLMSHLVDLLAFLVAPIAAVCASTSTLIPTRPAAEGRKQLDVGNEDSAIAMVRFEGGAEGVLEASRVATGHSSGIELALTGSGGSLAWRFGRMNELELALGELGSGDRGCTRVPAGPGQGAFSAFQPAAGLPMGYDDLKVIEAWELCRAIEAGDSPRPSLADAAAAARVLAAMERSAERGGWEAIEGC